MTGKTLAEWLRWQESLHSHEIELGLARVREVAERLALCPPPGNVFTVAGTNGKGSCVGLLEAMLVDAGYRTGAYTSPHLHVYNERVRLSGRLVSDNELIAAFEAVEKVRDDVPLTYFEFGTLAALWLFSQNMVDVWLLEVGMGGRLDAVNIIQTDFALVTTVALDHQEYLGESIEAIATEKAGIIHSGSHAYFGDSPVPAAITGRAQATGAALQVFGRDFNFQRGTHHWEWHGRNLRLSALELPPAAVSATLRNASVVLAALADWDSGMLNAPAVNRALLKSRQPGRFQIVAREHEWVFDVAHNPQAAEVLREQLERLPPASSVTAVVALLADKQAEIIGEVLSGVADRWLACTLDGSRGSSDRLLASRLKALMPDIQAAGSPQQALARARELTPAGGRIVVFGSFRLVGPALEWIAEVGDL